MLSTHAHPLLMELCPDKPSINSKYLKSRIQLIHITYQISYLSYHSIQQDMDTAFLEAKVHYYSATLCEEVDQV